jgi:hypothetical protein
LIPYIVVLDIKDITDTYRSASYLYRYREIDNKGNNSDSWLRTKLNDKRDDLICTIVNVPFICSTCISQLIRYSSACGSYHDFLGRSLLLTKKLLNQGV